MNYQIKLVTEGGRACVVKVKRFWFIPIPLTKRYYTLVSWPKVLEARRTPEWMSYEDANVTFASLKEKERELKKEKAIRKNQKRRTVLEEVY
jgi:hypothetical protein